jgi:hypothetical protein
MPTLRETALAAIATRLASQLSGVALDRARFGPVDVDKEPLPRVVLSSAELTADETAEPLTVHYTLSFAVQGYCTVARGTAPAVEIATSTLHARVVAALSGWTPAEPGLGEPSEEGADFSIYQAEDSAKPVGEFTARFSMLCLGPLIA